MSQHINRIGERADCITTCISADANEAVAWCLQLLRANAGGEAGNFPAPHALANRAWQDTVQLKSGPVRLVRFGDKCEALVIHAAAGSALTVDRLAGALINSVALDLPGHGEHARTAGHHLSVTECAQHVVDVLSIQNDIPALLAGEGEGAWVALEAARLSPGRCSGVLLLDPPVWSAGLRETIKEEGLPSMAPDWHGGHLSRAWHTVRDGRLFHPWFERTPAGIRWIEPDLDPLRLTLEVREMLSAEGHWQDLVRDAMAYPAVDRISELTVPVHVLIKAGNPSVKQLVAWVQTLAVAGYCVLPSRTADWPKAIRQLVRTSMQAS